LKPTVKVQLKGFWPFSILNGGIAMTVDYNILAKDYDLTRTANINTINCFAAEIPLDGKTILDFGCGTGNFAYAIKKLTTADIYGVEPSDGMREKSQAKGLDVRCGDHTAIPYDDYFFDFIYMTDVIHHVPDLKMMFAEFNRVLKPGGLVCILTESHRQLETRFWVKYFPTTVAVEKKRYPDIPDIVNAAKTARLNKYKVIVTDTDSEITISEDFVKLVENKGYSMFRLIEETDYQAGLAAMKSNFESNAVIQNNHGETLLWLKKEGLK
jgi:ubiquinone/menaquinone biosynthesis C-methylase UbiE